MIYFILIIFFGCYLTFDLLTRRFLDPWKLIMVFGKKGSGKSTLAAKLAVKYLRKGFYVYTNMADMNIQGVRLFNVDQLGDFVPAPRSLVLVDEAGSCYDARKWEKFKSSTSDFYRYQRHHKCIVYLFSQSFDVDKRLRDLTDYFYLVSKKLRIFSLAKRVERSTKLVEPTADSDGRFADGLRYASFTSWKLTYIPRYSKYFNSFNLLIRPELPFTNMSGIAVLKKPLKVRVKELVSKPKKPTEVNINALKKYFRKKS